MRADPPEGEIPAEAPPASLPVAAASAASFVTAAPAGGFAGAVVSVVAVAGVDDNGRVVVVVDRPFPPEDWGVVLEVDLPVGSVEGVEVEVVVTPESSESAAGVVVVVVDGSEEETVVLVVGDVDSVVGVMSSVVDGVALSSGSESPRLAKAGPAGTQTTTTNNVARVRARRTRRLSIRISQLERQRRRPHRVRRPFVTP